VLTIVTVALPQVSLAAGASKSHELVHSTVLFPTHEITGAVWSCTVTIWLQSAVLPQPSVARHVRVASKVLPQCPVVLVVVLKIVTVALPQVSLAVGASKVQVPVHSTVLLATHVIAGAVWSCTATV
jgi:hypothetical protein